MSEGDNSWLPFAFNGNDLTLKVEHKTPFLKLGMNKIKVTIDSQNKFSETNESNNSFEFTLEVVDSNNTKPF